MDGEFLRSYNQTWDLAAHCSKANREASLVEKKISCNSDASNQREKQVLVQRSTLPSSDNQWARAFIDRVKGQHAERAWSVLTVILKSVIGHSWNCGSLCQGHVFSSGHVWM